MYSDFAAFSIITMSVSDQKRVQFRDLHRRAEFSPPPTPSGAADTASSLGGVSATDTDGGCADDGFRTPTDSDRMIPEIRPCPPPPRKTTKARALKRKNSPGEEVLSRNRRARILLDFSREVESMFPPVLRENLTCKIKKARSV